MTTCPRCGRVAGDEFVCAGYGAFLAGSEGGGTAAPVSVRRVAVLVFIVCLLGLGGAALLLRGGGGRQRADLSIPLGSSPVELSRVPLGAPGDPGSGGTSGPVQPTGPGSTSNAASSPTRSAGRSRSTTPGSTHPSSTRAGSSSATPHPSTSTPRPSRSQSSPPPARQVALGQTSSPTCGRHCHVLTVTLSNFPAGSHRVSCFDEHARQIGSYTTSATTSARCSYDRPHAAAYVVVDGTRSNTVTW